MAPVTRKDYGTNAIVKPSNPTLKRVKTENTPKSIAATGHVRNKSKYIAVTEENLNNLQTNTRVLQGNIEKYVKSIATSGDPATFDSMVIAYRDKKGQEVTENWSKQDVLSSSSIQFATTD